MIRPVEEPAFPAGDDDDDEGHYVPPLPRRCRAPTRSPRAPGSR
ncbi:hypothetical protein ACFQY7_00590 [Actinomadura luteofluorescens]